MLGFGKIWASRAECVGKRKTEMQAKLGKHQKLFLYGFPLSICQTTKNGHDRRSFSVISACANFFSGDIFKPPSVLALTVDVKDSLKLSLEAG